MKKHSSSVRKANKSESNSNYQDNIQNNPSSTKTVDVNFLPENELEKEKLFNKYCYRFHRKKEFFKNVARSVYLINIFTDSQS